MWFIGWDLVTLNHILDFINLMAYNFNGSNINWPQIADNPAPLYKRSWETDPTLNVDYLVKYYINNGIKPFKITLGIPFHGMAWSLLTEMKYAIITRLIGGRLFLIH